MDKVYEYMHKDWVILSWSILVIVLLLLLVFSQKERFLNEFRSAPVNRQLPSSQLGIGSTSRFQEFSSTNQGGSHVVGEMASRSENMMGGPEAPVFTSIDKSLGDYQRSSRSEDFGVKKFYSDAFGNPDAKLNRVLQGL